MYARFRTGYDDSIYIGTSHHFFGVRTQSVPQINMALPKLSVPDNLLDGHATNCTNVSVNQRLTGETIRPLPSLPHGRVGRPFNSSYLAAHTRLRYNVVVNGLSRIIHSRIWLKTTTCQATRVHLSSPFPPLLGVIRVHASPLNTRNRSSARMIDLG